MAAGAAVVAGAGGDAGAGEGAAPAPFVDAGGGGGGFWAADGLADGEAAIATVLARPLVDAAGNDG